MPDQIIKAVRLTDGAAWAIIRPDFENDEGFWFCTWEPTDKQAERILAIAGVKDLQRSRIPPFGWQIVINAPNLDQLIDVYEAAKQAILTVFCTEDTLKV